MKKETRYNEWNLTLGDRLIFDAPSAGVLKIQFDSVVGDGISVKEERDTIDSLRTKIANYESEIQGLHIRLREKRTGPVMHGQGCVCCPQVD